jgi:hypothetical protein
MAVLIDKASTELVIPVSPTVVHRTIEYRGENMWEVQGWSLSFSSAFAAMSALREDIERDARHPTRIDIRWRGVPANFTPPVTGTALV